MDEQDNNSEPRIWAEASATCTSGCGMMGLGYVWKLAEL